MGVFIPINIFTVNSALYDSKYELGWSSDRLVQPFGKNSRATFLHTVVTMWCQSVDVVRISCMYFLGMDVSYYKPKRCMKCRRDLASLADFTMQEIHRQPRQLKSWQPRNELLSVSCGSH